MKPILSEVQDNEALQNLGQASLQVIHDLKNHLNGLKLYATFIKRRLEKTDRPADELETVDKLMAGIDRAAVDLSSLVEYGRPIALQKQPKVDLKEVLSRVLTSLSKHDSVNSPPAGTVVDVDFAPEPIVGEFDPSVLAEALQFISVRALQMRSQHEPERLKIRLKLENTTRASTAVIEWDRIRAQDQDPFKSFMGGDAVRMSLAARLIEAHAGSAEHKDGLLCVRLPLG